MLFDFLFIVTVTTWLFGLALAGRLSIEVALAAALGLVVLRAIARGLGVGLARLVFGIGLPVAAFIALTNSYAATAQERVALAGALGVVVIALFGFYVMLRGVFSR